jgi:hypothetical protein
MLRKLLTFVKAIMFAEALVNHALTLTHYASVGVALPRVSLGLVEIDVGIELVVCAPKAAEVVYPSVQLEHMVSVVLPQNFAQQYSQLAQALALCVTDVSVAQGLKQTHTVETVTALAASLVLHLCYVPLNVFVQLTIISRFPQVFLLKTVLC